MKLAQHTRCAISSDALAAFVFFCEFRHRLRQARRRRRRRLDSAAQQQPNSPACLPPPSQSLQAAVLWRDSLWLCPTGTAIAAEHTNTHTQSLPPSLAQALGQRANTCKRGHHRWCRRTVHLFAALPLCVTVRAGRSSFVCSVATQDCRHTTRGESQRTERRGGGGGGGGGGEPREIAQICKGPRSMPPVRWFGRSAAKRASPAIQPARRAHTELWRAGLPSVCACVSALAWPASRTWQCVRARSSACSSTSATTTTTTTSSLL